MRRNFRKIDALELLHQKFQWQVFVAITICYLAVTSGMPQYPLEVL